MKLKIISFEQTNDFIENVQGLADPLSTAYYTSDTQELFSLLTKIRSYTSGHQIKTKCTKKRELLNN